MAAKKKAAKKKKKLSSKSLGTGLAAKAGAKLGGRALQLKRQECRAMGGTWSNGKCG